MDFLSSKQALNFRLKTFAPCKSFWLSLLFDKAKNCKLSHRFPKRKQYSSTTQHSNKFNFVWEKQTRNIEAIKKVSVVPSSFIGCMSWKCFQQKNCSHDSLHPKRQETFEILLKTCEFSLTFIGSFIKKSIEKDLFLQIFQCHSQVNCMLSHSVSREPFQPLSKY